MILESTLKELVLELLEGILDNNTSSISKIKSSCLKTIFGYVIYYDKSESKSKIIRLDLKKQKKHKKINSKFDSSKDTTTSDKTKLTTSVHESQLDVDIKNFDDKVVLGF